MNAPDIALLLIHIVLKGLGPHDHEQRCETFIKLAQTLIALRRLDEAWSAALEVISRRK